ncbi:Gfo/Idh/MocA family oxidoreductase [Haloarchaeobius sp. TZWSO28]|uniref:Gfo/Idh/MocA family oxidoreductase n=1 Tax=Haloarchaeobius sp. TZWSO28 TaxID=3446119 RepID=UPI003EBC04E2
MVDIGIVGLDTSHAESFAEEVQGRASTTITGVWDGGDVRDESYLKTYCEQYDAVRYDDPHAMVGAVDAVMILTVNWDTHRELAVPFLENDVVTLVDKPIAGTLADVHAIEKAAEGTPFFGGSAVPFHSNVQSFDFESDGRTLYCVGFDDPFYYGVHLVDTVCRIVDEAWATVRPSYEPGQTIEIVFKDGTYVTVRLDSTGDEEQFAFLTLDNQASTARVGSSRADLADMYERYIDTFLQISTGERPSDTRVFDAAKLSLAVQAALEHGSPITPECQLLAEYDIDGRNFLENYIPYY